MASVVENLPIHKNNVVPVENVFKKGLLSISKPFDLMQALFILSMYRVRDGFITSNSVFYNVVSGIWSLLLLVSYCLSMFKNVFTSGLEGFNFVKFSCNILIVFLYCLGNVTIYWTNVVQRHNNVRLVIRIQNICEMLQVNGKSLKKFMIMNWVYVMALNSFRVFCVINLNVAYTLVFHIYETITNLYYMIFDVNMLYCVRLMKLLSESLRIWVDDALKTSKGIADTENELYWNRKFRVYMEIAETHEIVGKTFQPLILYYCIDTFTNGVISIWLRIEIAKVVGASMIKVALSLISLLWLFRNLLLVTALCLECQRFYSIMTEVRSTCIQLTTSDTCPEAQKKVCKNIRRVQTTSFKKMSACGLFVMDGTLPLLLFGLLTTYIIVVLQFEFL